MLNNFQNDYTKLIEHAKCRKLESGIYVEKHHIIPVSMNGSNLPENIVELTASEHFHAHYLLWKIHNNREMTHAFMLMCHIKRNGIKYKIDAEEYQLLKETNKKFRSEFMTGRAGNNLGKTLPQDWKDNISKGQKGHHRGKGKVSSFKGKSHTKEAKQKISEKRKGIGTHFTPHSDETKVMMSENRKGKPKAPWTEERKAARRRLLAEKFSQQKSSD